MFVFEGPTTNGAVTYAHLVIAPGTFNAADSVLV